MNALQKQTFTLPAYWASYLINGDTSGISAEDKAAADKFMADNKLPAPVSCSDEGWFARSNDSGNGLAGEVFDYVFLVEVQKDFSVENHGSIVLVRPLTQAAKDWLAEHTPHDADHTYWGSALVVEPRYLENLLEGISGDGLSV